MHDAKNLKPLTSIRGIAAVWVYLSHCQYLKASTPFFAMLTGNGYYGVDVFFILSGFILSHVHLADFKTRAMVRENYGRFQLLRLARIYPLHLITLLVVLLFHATDIFGWPQQDSAETFLGHLLLLHATGWFGEVQSWNLVTWSISVEWILYLCFPVFAWLVANRIRRASHNLLLVIVPIVAWAVYFQVTGVDMTWMHEAGRNLVRGGLDFTIGVGLYNLFRAGFLATLPWDTIAVLTFAEILLAVWTESQAIRLSGVVYVALFTVLIYALANIRGYANWLFSNRPVVFLGTISYSLYMWHWIFIIFILSHLFEAWSANPVFFSWQFALQTFALIGLSALSFRGIENPVRQWVRRRFVG